MQLLPFFQAALLVSSPKSKVIQSHANRDVLRLAEANLEKDLKSLKARNTKFQKFGKRNKKRGGTFWAKFLEENAEYVDLYSACDCDNGEGPLSILVSRVGPLRRTKVEDMIHFHPRLMFHILSSDMQSIRSVPDQLRRDLRLSSEQMAKFNAVYNSKRLRTNRESIRSITSYLQDRIQMNPTSIAKFILKAPQVLNYSADKILFSIEYFLEAGFSNEDIARMILLKPMVLSYSPSSKLEPVLMFLKNIGKFLGQTSEKSYFVFFLFKSFSSVLLCLSTFRNCKLSQNRSTLSTDIFYQG